MKLCKDERFVKTSLNFFLSKEYEERAGKEENTIGLIIDIIKPKSLPVSAKSAAMAGLIEIERINSFELLTNVFTKLEKNIGSVSLIKERVIDDEIDKGESTLLFQLIAI